MRYVLLLLAVLVGMMVPRVSSAVEDGSPAVSAASQARLDRAESLLDAWSGQGDGLDEARAELDRVLRDEPQSANAHRLYARYYLSSGHISGESFEPGSIEAAEKSLAKAVEIAPGYARAYVLQGHVYRLMKKPAQARASLQQADRLGTDDPWLQLNWGQLLMEENHEEQAAARYRKVLQDNASPRTSRAAREGLIAYYKHNNKLAEADAMYRASILADPSSAWSHGNYAGYRLCWRDDAEGAITEATKARDLMDYGLARMTLVAALYRKWAALALDGNKLAEEPLAAARRVLPIGPGTAIEEVCGGGPAVLAVLQAMLMTGEGERIPAKVAGVLAAEEEGRATGLYVMKVQASGRDGGRLFLNSEADYRDARNLSLVFVPEVESAFKRKHGSAPDEFLKGKDIVVLGTARQVKVYFTNRGVPSDKYYYQTHVNVAKPDYIRVAE